MTTQHLQVQHNNGKTFSEHMLAPSSDWNRMSESEHFVQFYETDASFLNSLSDFIGTALKAGDTAVVVATKAHRESLEARLQEYGLDLTSASASGQYVSLDAAELLSKFMVDGSPEPGRFNEVVGGIIARASSGRRRVRVFGEMVALLWMEGNYTAAIRIEELWNELHKTHSFSLFCAYPINGSDAEGFIEHLGNVCAEHSRVIPVASYAAIVESSDDAIISKTLNGIITSWNKGAEVIFGYSADEVIGKSVLILIPPDRYDEEPKILKRLRRGERIDHYETVRKCKDGRLIDISLTVSPIKDSSGHIIGASKVARDITERKKAEEALRVSENRYRRLFEASRDCILIVDPGTHKITDANPSMTELLGLTHEELLGKELWEIGLLKDRDTTQETFQKLREEHVIRYEHLVLQSKDGRPRDVEFVSNIYQANGHQVIQCNLHDITKRKRLEDELRQTVDRLKKADQAKDEFLALITHELKGPLNAIMGWARLLGSGKLDSAAGVRAIETIARNAKTQDLLINDLLDVSRIITGKLYVEFRMVDLISVVENALDVIRPMAEDKKIQLETRINPVIGPVSGDFHRLQQVVLNLLINAIKFTPVGGRVEVKLKSSNTHAQIKVSDTGQGISPDILPHIFERFRQAKDRDTRAKGGLGLGLWLVKSLVEIHGGMVCAESKGMEQGATFTVELPLAGRFFNSRDTNF